MCLDSFKTRNNTCDVGYGWKIFNERKNRQIRFRYRKHEGNFIVPINKWLKIKSKSYIDSWGGKYHTGFHIYTDYNEAKKIFSFISFDKNCIIRKVAFKGVYAIGRDSGVKVIVAREMFVLPKKENE
jgi:hypothetical protein